MAVAKLPGAVAVSEINSNQANRPNKTTAGQTPSQAG
jgi:hypothetical protein